MGSAPLILILGSKMKKEKFVLLIAISALAPSMAGACAINGDIGNYSQIFESCEQSWAVHGGIKEGI